MRRTSIRRASATGLVVLVGAFAGCGGGGDEETTATESAPEATQTEAPPAEAAQEVQVAAVEGASGLGWEPADLTASAGTVTVTMDNPEGNEMPHTVAIEGNGVDESGEAVQAGQTSTVTADLEAGEYTFYCPVGEHRENGMEGALTVE